MELAERGSRNVQRESSLYNEDLAPVPAEKRTWGIYNYASLWVAMSVCIPTYMLASGLIAGGMSWKQAIGTILLGNIIVLIPMILNAHAGAKYGIPFPVLVRASFGVRGANVPAVLRALVACGWFGIQSWIGGQAIYTMLQVLWPRAATSMWTPWICFYLFWLLTMAVIWRGIDTIKFLEGIGAPFMLAVGLLLLWWIARKAGGLGPVLHTPSKFQTTRDFMRFFIPSLTGMVGFWATVALNIPDFTRYARSQKAQMIGQALGLPPAMTIYSFIGVAVTSASVILFGQAIWDPVALLARFHEPVIASIALVALLVATLNTNVAANVVSPSNDFSNLNPRLISFRRGGLITGVVGVLMMPWKLLTDFQSYIFGWLVGYSALLGPIAGIMITDYFLLRHTYLDVAELYNPTGIYRYRSGVNYRAIFALAAGIVVALIGLVVSPLRWLYDYAWFVGFLVASVTYWVLMRNAKAPVRVACCFLAIVFLAHAQPTDSARLAQYRNLGKAFYENPTTQKQAVDEFHRALMLAPNSVREQINYGLALLRAGETQRGIAELEKAQKTDPKIPHTWFNLGVYLRKEGKQAEALEQFRGMERLVPDEPVTHYQIGSILKTKGDLNGAIKEFEIAKRLDPRLAAPHFQLYGLYRQNRPQDSAEELRVFQDLKKQQEGAAIPEDMEWSAYAEIYDPINERASSLAPPVYRGEKIADGFIGPTAGVAAIDLDGGPRPSLIAWSAAGVKVFRQGRTLVADSGLEHLKDVVFIAPGDFDNDGFPDLCVITNRGADLYRNVDGKFRKQADLATGSFRQAVWMDYDHDYDLDLFLLGDQPKLLRNNGSAGFSDETKRFPFVQGRALQAVRFDLEPDTQGFDLIASYQDRPGVLYRDRLGGSYAAVDLNGLPAGATNLTAFDFNRDGRTDLAAHAQPDLLLLNRPQGFEKAIPPAFPANGNFVATDFNANGRLDRAYIASDGALMMDRDVTPNYANWIEIALTGVKNLKTAIGAKVEVKAGASYEKQTYAGVPLVFRLGARTSIDTIRIFWPNGLIQNEINQPVNRILAIKEKPRLAGSCPMIYTWDGKEFSFLTDVLGVAPLGASSGDGEFFPTDHQEYVYIPGESLKEKDGAYEVRVTEELREVSFTDQIKLQAVDHPATVDIVTNEKFKSPPYPDFRLFGVSRRIHPISAHDQNGTDVLSKVLKRDFVYPDFPRTPTATAEMHSLTLDFGKAATSNLGANQAVLILDGWFDWPDGSTFLAAAQEHKDLTFPYLQVKDAAGNWKTVIEDMGMPSGRQKPIAVDLAGKFLSDSREVRIVTNMCVYWDEIFLIEDGAAPPAKLTTLPIESADLHFRGFSRMTMPANRMQGEAFDYNSVSATTMWNPTPGNYTRYGDVKSLLVEPDDRMAIIGSGDEIKLRFRASGLPPLPAGWKRDFLLLVDGWAKDADANTAFSQTVLPLPFHAMTSYPYPAGQRYPHDPVHDEYQKEYNTRPALRLIRPLFDGPREGE